jgi:hypothetical protein
MSIKALLWCGVLSSLIYVAMNVFIPMLWDEYDIASQTVSELSAIDSPTRPIWVPFGIVYTLLIAAFGFGVRKSAHGIRSLRVAGMLLIIYGIIGVAWPPMHQREVLAAGGGSVTDTLHIVFTFITVSLMFLVMGFGAAAFGRPFRIYTIATILVQLVFGVMTGLDAPALEADLATPWLGVWERINIGVYMIWVVVFAVLLLRKEFSSSHANYSTAVESMHH